MPEYKTTKERSLDMAFLIGPENLKQLEELLAEVNGPQWTEVQYPVEYKVKFSDGSTVTYFSAREVSKQPNSDKRFIVSVVAGAEGRTYPLSTFVTLRNDPAPSVEYTVSGPQRDVVYLAGKLDDWIGSCSQWYSLGFSKLTPLVGLAAFLLPLFLADRIGKIYPVNTGVPGITLFASIVAETLLFRLFPRGTFAIGYGARRHQLFSAVRNVLVFGFVVSFIAGLAANWITKHL